MENFYMFTMGTTLLVLSVGMIMIIIDEFRNR
jgi:predicted type IV restriction endonuclease